MPTSPEIMATSQEVETLLKKFSATNPKLNALEPRVFVSGKCENPKYWLKMFINNAILNKSDAMDKKLCSRTFLRKQPNVNTKIFMKITNSHGQASTKSSMKH